MNTLAKIALSVLLVGASLTMYFSMLPYEFDVLPLSDFRATLDLIVNFLNSTLNLFSGFFDVVYLILILKLVLSMYILGFSIKLFQWVVSYFK